MAFTEDLTEFFDTDDFAVPATIGAATVYGIFDNAYYGIPGEAPITGTQPMFMAASSDLSAVVAGTTLVINSVTYTATGPAHADGTGVSVVTLRE